MFSIGHASAQVLAPEDVTWTSATGTTPSYPTPGSGSTLTRNTAAAAWANDAVSTKRILGDGGVQFQFGQADKYVMVGLAVDNPNHSYTSIDYAIEATSAGQIYIWENNVSRGTFGGYSSTDVFRIERIGASVQYYKNNQPLYPSTVKSIGSLLVDDSLYSPSAYITKARYYGGSPVADVHWESVAGSPTGTYTTPQAGSQLSKTATAAAWDTGASGEQLVTGNGGVQFKITQTTKQLAVGLCASYTSAVPSALDYCFQTTATSAAFQIVEKGVQKASGTYATTDIFRIQRAGSQVTYFKNDVAIGLTTPSTPAATSSMVVGCSFYGNGAVNSVQVLSPSVFNRVVWKNSSANCTARYDSGRSTLQRNASGGTSGWSEGAVSTKAIVLDGILRFGFGQINQGAALGLSAASSDNGNRSIGYSIETTAGAATFQVRENGVLVDQVRPYWLHDVFTIRRVGGSGPWIEYWQNGTLFFAHQIPGVNGPMYADASLADGGAAVVNCEYYGVPEDVVWRDGVSTTSGYPSPGGAGSTLTKTTGAATGWNADAISTTRLIGDGFVEWHFGQINQNVMLALSYANPDRGYLSLDYALECTATGALYRWLHGASTSLGVTAAAGDTFRIERTDGAILFVGSDASGVEKWYSFYPVSSSGDLFVDTSFYTAGAAVTGCVIYQGGWESGWDVNGNEIDDRWEYEMLGGLDPSAGGSGDPDGDSFTNLEEYLAGTSPLDFYNGDTPAVSVTADSYAYSDPGIVSPHPLTVLISDRDTGLPLPGAPVTFVIANGGGLLSTSSNGAAPSSTVNVVADQNGVARVYCVQPNVPGATTTVAINAGLSTPITFQFLTHDLVGLWRFNETSGMTAIDSSTYGHNATLSNGAIRVAGFGMTQSLDTMSPGGTAMYLDGVHDVQAPTSSTLAIGSGSGTVMAWVQPYQLDTFTYPLFSQQTVDTSVAASPRTVTFSLALQGGTANGLSATLTNVVTGQNPTTTTLQPLSNQHDLLMDGHPHLVAFVYAAGAAYLYIDGIDVSSSSPAGKPFVGPLPYVPGAGTFGVTRIGSSFAPTTYFQGLLDDVRLLRTPLRADEIKAYFDRDADGLPDWWEFAQFSNLSQIASGDFDSDGLSNLVEYNSQTNPLLGTVTQLSYIGGLRGPASHLAGPIEIDLTDGHGAPIRGGTIQIVVTSGGGGLTLNPAASAASTVTSMTATTDRFGAVQLYYFQPPFGAVTGHITVTAASGGSLQLYPFTEPLVGRWGFEEAGGTTALDSSGVGNDGTISVSRGQGFEGQSSMAVPGQDAGGGLSVSNAGNHLLPASGTQPFTMALWFRTRPLPVGTSYPIAQNESNQQSGFRFAIDNGYWHSAEPGLVRLLFWSGQSGGTLELKPVVPITAEVWHQVAVTYDGTTGRMYLDGSLAYQAAGTILPNNNPLTFGRKITGGAGDFNGEMDDIRVYASALADTDVQALWNSDFNGNGIPEWWENQYFQRSFGTGPSDPKATDDPDGDGLTNLDEYRLHLNPLAVDTDGNGISDGFEDFDGDGLPNAWELQHGRDPTNPNDASLSGIPAAEGPAYFVAINGSDASPGTAASPFRTVQHALDVARPFTVINVQPGTYTENLRIKSNVEIIGLGIASAPAVLQEAVLSGTAAAACFRDDNGNGAWDPGEPLWLDRGTSPGIFDSGDTLVCDSPVDPLLAGSPGRAVAAFFADTNQNGVADPDEAVWIDLGSSAGVLDPGDLVVRGATYLTFPNLQGVSIQNISIHASGKVASIAGGAAITLINVMADAGRLEAVSVTGYSARIEALGLKNGQGIRWDGSAEVKLNRMEDKQ